MDIAIIGHGFVGQAVSNSYKDVKDINTIIVDPADPKATCLDFAIEEAQIFFICLPTPSNEDGSCDTDLVEMVIRRINKTIETISPLIIIKSTMPPDALQELEDESIVPIVYNPEFLTQANSIQDYLTPQMHILGGRSNATRMAEVVLTNISKCQPCPIYKTDIKTAALAKYAINSYLATKVSFMNELFQLHHMSGAESSFAELASILSSDSRIGKSHLQVPGPDGEFGFGGACFPKDTKAFVEYAKTKNTNLDIISSAIEVNQKIRNKINSFT